MRRKLVIALLGLGVIVGYGGELARIRHLHRTGALTHGCHREHACRWEARHAQSVGSADAVPSQAAPTVAVPATPPAK